MKYRILALLTALLLICFSGCSVFPLNQSGLFGDDTETPGTSVSSDRDSAPDSSVAATDSQQGTDSSESSDTDTEPHDILKTPIGQLTAEEQEELAEYLFEYYIPCSYGIFSNAKELSSASVWSSVEALNQLVDKDTSEGSHTLEDVEKKVKIYYPDTPFDPASVRLYDPDSKTFYASPFTPEEYVFLSYEIKGNTITIHYEDTPDGDDPARYATTLKNSGTEGYFAFVSSVREGAVG